MYLYTYWYREFTTVCSNNDIHYYIMVIQCIVPHVVYCLVVFYVIYFTEVEYLYSFLGREKGRYWPVLPT